MRQVFAIARASMGALVAVLALGCVPAAWAAEAFPSQPIRMVLPYPPGGGIDAVGRPLAEQLSKQLGQPVIVDNRGGANGAIGMDIVAEAPPDGHTIVLALDSQFSINPNIYKSLPYDPIKDYAPVTLIGTVPYILVASSSLPVKTVDDMIAYVKAHKNKVNYASSGVGSGAHLATALLESMTGISMVHIPNKSTSSAMRDVAENDAQFMFVTYGAAAGMIQAGRLRPIGVTGTKRMPLLPDVPPIAESLPGYETGVAYGIFAPAGTPADIVGRLNAEIVKVIESPTYQKNISASGVEVHSTSPQEFGAYVQKELDKWQRIVRESHIPQN